MVCKIKVNYFPPSCKIRSKAMPREPLIQTLPLVSRWKTPLRIKSSVVENTPATYSGLSPSVCTAWPYNGPMTYTLIPAPAKACNMRRCISTASDPNSNISPKMAVRGPGRRCKLSKAARTLVGLAL